MMKKTIILLMLLLAVTVVFTACTPSDETSDVQSSVSSPETESTDTSDAVSADESKPADESTDISEESDYVALPTYDYVPDSELLNKFFTEGIVDKKHVECFLELNNTIPDDYSFYGYFDISKEKRVNFYLMYSYTHWENLGFLLEYYGITEIEYQNYVNVVQNLYNEILGYYGKGTEALDKSYPLFRYVKGWYSENYMEDPLMIKADYEKKGDTYYAENRDGKHNLIYYTIDYRLINYVGKDKFDEYLDKTDDVNILSFIDYFELDWYTFSGIINEDASAGLPYNTYFVFGTDEQKEAYFGFVDDQIELDKTLFRPLASPNDDNVQAIGDGIHDPRYFLLTEEIFSKLLGKKVEFTNTFINDTNEFAKMFYMTDNWNFGFFIEYYGISRETWEEWCDELYPAETRDTKGLAWQYDLWFNQRYEQNVMTVSRYYDFPEVRTYYGEKIDAKYNSAYYKIDRQLILKVGVDKFENFLDKYEGTADCNVMKFIEEFGLKKADLEKLYDPENNEGRTAYNIDMMFDRPEAYFGYAE